MMNEILRQALLRAGLDEVDVATRLEVDPKTVRRWLEGRLPYVRYRWELANLLNLNETDIWSELRTSTSRPNELLAIYPHRSSVPLETWRNLFDSAKHQISVLDYSSLFLIEDGAVNRIFAEKANAGVRIRIVIGDPDTLHAHCDSRQIITTEPINEIREALALYQTLTQISRIEVRLHQVALYNSIYRADDKLLVAQHLYGLPASHSPTLHLQLANNGDMGCAYIKSFRQIWSTARV